MSAVQRSAVALWRWDRGELVPDARLVVCAPGVGWVVEANREQVVAHHGRGGHLVVSGGAFNGSAPPGILPALHVRTRVDLARLPDLLAVQSERRALVLSPGEAIDLSADLVCVRCPSCFKRVRLDDYYDQNTRFKCGSCGAVGQNATRAWLDLVIAAGFDEPLHPTHVRSVVEQCREAGVPVIFAGWGEWVTFDQLSDEAADTADLGVESRGSGRLDEPFWYRVGAERSGALLDGEALNELPEWIGGEE